MFAWLIRKTTRAANVNDESSNVRAALKQMTYWHVLDTHYL